MRSLFIALFLFPTFLFAQNNADSRFTAMGNAAVALTGPNALSGNAAGITSLQKTFMTLSVQNEWLLSPLRIQASLIAPLGIGHLGLSGGTYLVGEEYQEFQAGLAFAKRLSERFSASVDLHYEQFSFPLAEIEGSRFAAGLGLQYHYSSHWIWGIHLLNPVNIQNLSDYYPRRKIKLGTSYLFSSQALIGLEFSHSADQQFQFAAGLEYAVLQWLKLRGGTSLNPFQRSLGMGFEVGQIYVDAAATFHPELGASPKMTMMYAF